jgi:ribosome modulation factor
MICAECRGSGKFGSRKCHGCNGTGFANIAAEDDRVEAVDPTDPAEVERRGRVAYHHGKDRDDCPFSDGDPLQERWLAGWDGASSRKNRLDMSPARAWGWRAFRDGVHNHECPCGAKNRKEASEWHAGWQDARDAKDRDDARRYR